MKQTKTWLLGLAAVTGLSASDAWADPTDAQIKSLIAQQHLDYDVPIYDATFVGTHNSFSSSAYDYASTIKNQNHSIWDQLDAGYRWLDIDAHQFAEGIGWDDGPNTTLCHGWCAYADMTLDQFLGKVDGWLDTHPGEVIFITVQDEFEGYEHWGNHTAEDGRERFEREVKGNDIWNRIFTNADLPSGINYYQKDKCVIFPMELTKRDILEAGRQVVLLRWNADDLDSRCGNNSTSDIFDVTFDIPFGDIAEQSSLHNINIEESKRGNISQFYVAQDDRCYSCDSDKDITSDEYIEILERGAHMVTLDFAVDQSKHDAVTWSWATGEPNDAGGNEDCVTQKTTGRWNDAQCNNSNKYFNVACQSELTGEWKVTASTYLHSEANDACLNEFGDHYFFSTPVHAKSNKRLREAGDAAGAGDTWINMARHAKAGSFYFSAAGHMVYSSPLDFTPVDYLKRGKSRQNFYLKDEYGKYVRNACGGDCSSEDAFAESTFETYTGNYKKLWLIQTYQAGMGYFFIGTGDGTVWGNDDGLARSDRQSLHIDNSGSIFYFPSGSGFEDDPHNWPTGGTDGTQLGIFNFGTGVMVHSTGDQYAPLKCESTQEGFRFQPHWQ